MTSEEVDSSTYTNWDSYQEAVESHAKLIWELHADARNRSSAVQHVRQAKENARNRHRMNDDFWLGDLVWYDHRRTLKAVRRGLQRWIGPFRIVAITPGPNYTLRGIEGNLGQEIVRVHPQFVKSFHEPMALRVNRERSTDLGEELCGTHGPQLSMDS